MKTYTIPHTDLKTSRIAYGAMLIGGSWDDSPLSDTARANTVRVVRTALDCGINFFDHADIYCRGKSDMVFSEAIAELAHKRDKFILQTKCGIRFRGDPAPNSPGRYDFSFEHIIASVDASLRRLRAGYIDILLLHRPDALVEPAEVARALDQLQQSGKVRHFGVSNHNWAQIELLRTCVRQPFVANQVELNLIHTGLLDAGTDFNQGRTSLGCTGTLDYCRLHKIMIQAWSPVAKGRAMGKWTEAATPEPIDDLAKVVGELSIKKNVSKIAIATAWLLRHPAQIQPVIGTTKAERLAAACQADGVELTREEWYQLYGAGRGRHLG